MWRKDYSLFLLRITAPAIPETRDAINIPVLAEERNSEFPNANPAMKSDMVKPIPVSHASP